MFKLKFIFTLWFSYLCLNSNGQNIKSCNDCILISNCPGVNELLLKHDQEPETLRKIKSAYCGYSYQGKQRVPKICCSDFSLVKDAIETHSNLHLLPKSCGEITGYRILGGKFANMYEYPWMVLISHKIGNNLEFGCGGSIINSRYVLTSAHCVKNKVIIGVRIGEYNLREYQDCQGYYPNMICESKLQDIRIEEQIVHTNYSAAPIVRNDIALLRLKNDINFNHRNSRPICLPISQELRKPIKDGESSAVAGWGLTDTSLDSSVLLKVYIPVSTMTNCTAIYNKNKTNVLELLSSKKFCAGDLNKYSCVGDPGGPLMLEREYDGINRIVQYGIVSHGPRQCGIDVPGIYTDVSKYMDWILDNIKP